MNRFRYFAIRLLASLIALVFMFGTLLVIAYYYELGTPQPEDRAAVLAVTGVTVLNLTDASFVPNTTILISGRRILAIQPDGLVPAGARVIHAPGRFALPPLADAAIFFEAPTLAEHRILSGEWAWEITRALPEHRRVLTAAGVAAAQDLGGGLDTILTTQRLLTGDKLAGPHLSVAGPILTIGGGCPAETFFPDRYEDVTRQLASAIEAQQVVQSLAQEGVNAISVCFSDFGGLFARMNPVILEEIVQTAHQFGLPVLAITTSGEDVEQAVAAGVDALVGGVSIQDESLDGAQLAAMREQGALYIPTLSAVQSREEDGRESLATAQANTRLVYEAGISILAGTGMAARESTTAFSMQHEIQLLVESGLSEIDALRAATTDPGRFLQRPELAGIQVGGPASLILLSENPLDDIRALGEIELFLQDGMVMLDYLSAP